MPLAVLADTNISYPVQPIQQSRRKIAKKLLHFESTHPSGLVHVEQNACIGKVLDNSLFVNGPVEFRRSRLPAVYWMGAKTRDKDDAEEA